MRKLRLILFRGDIVINILLIKSNKKNLEILISRFFYNILQKIIF